MAVGGEFRLIQHKYEEAYGAKVRPDFPGYFTRRGAALGYRRASADALFVEQYLGEPVEAIVSRKLGRQVERHDVVELGNFASNNALAMIELWGAAANDLAGTSEVAVATLTGDLRQMFARIGLPIVSLAPARPESLAGSPEVWGSYYTHDPEVCAGLIVDGKAAIDAFLSSRRRADCA